jgi:hypothetical protein
MKYLPSSSGRCFEEMADAAGPAVLMAAFLLLGLGQAINSLVEAAPSSSASID